jgi:hypothetical protein
MEHRKVKQFKNCYCIWVGGKVARAWVAWFPSLAHSYPAFSAAKPSLLCPCSKPIDTRVNFVNQNPVS